jgi:hypothetical protein
MLMVILLIAMYVFCAICLKRIAEKTGQAEKSWYAWIPIANMVLTCWIAGKPGWWTVLMLIPIVNIVFSVIIWINVAKACSKPAWLGWVIVLVPIGNFVAMGHLAFSK